MDENASNLGLPSYIYTVWISLLRFMKNAFNHYNSIPENIRDEIAPSKGALETLFRTSFPGLMTILFNEGQQHDLSKGTNSLQAEEQDIPPPTITAMNDPYHQEEIAKSRWEEIKSRFGGNVESKKMQKIVLKHQFENVSTASNESLDKAYDRFQKLISQLEVHGAPISKEDINQKFLKSLPSSWNQIALIMRNKPDIDDLYNNLRVYEDELKRSSGSNSASQNLAFLSSENTGGTNEVSTASGDFGVSTAGGINQVPSTPCAHDVAYSFLAQPTTSPQLENEDFQLMDGE
ncbi:ribonuclease H-like domain-containing protein [Tanacetum coccineum]